MSAEKNLSVIQDIYAAFGRGDIAAVMARISDDVGDFGIISGAKTAVPWHLNGRGKADAARYFEALGAAVEFRAFEPRDLAATGDHVYATLRMGMRIRATGEPLELAEVVHHFTLKDGLVVRWRGTEDTKVTHDAFARSR